MNIKKLGAIVLAGVISCTAPAAVMAAEDTTQEILMENQVDSLLEDPDKAVDIIMYVKDLVDRQNVSDEEISGVIDQAAEHFQITLTDSDKESLISMIHKFKDMDLDEEQLRSDVKKAYEKLEDLGVDKEDVKNILEKAVDFVKSLFE